MLGACTPRPGLQFLAAWNLHICYAATLLPGLCPRGEPRGQVCRQKTGWWAGLASHAGTRTQASEPDRQGSSAAGTAAPLYHGHFWDGFLLCFGSSLYKLIMCNQYCAQKLDAGSREIHKQPWLVLQDLFFAAGSGNSCCLASVSPLPLLGGAAPASGTARSGGGWGQISQRATRDRPCLQPGICAGVSHCWVLWATLFLPLLYAGLELEEKGKGSDAVEVLTLLLCCLHMFCCNAVIIIKCFLSIFPARHQNYCHHPVSMSLQECPQGLPLHLAEQDVLVWGTTTVFLLVFHPSL